MGGTVLRLAGYQPARSIHTRALRRLADRLRHDLGVPVELTENVTACGLRADHLLAMTEGDELDICYFSSSYLAARVPSLGEIDRPFRFADRAAAYALLDGDAGQRMADDVMRASGLRVLAFWDNGFRHISNARRPLRHPADCAGLRIRTLDNAAHQAFFRRLGFTPMFLDVKDLAAAAAAGTIDAQENPLTNIVNFGLQRYHPFVSMTAHLFGAALLLVNRGRFERWPQHVRTALQAAAADVTAAQRAEAEREDEACSRQLAAEGVQFIRGAELDRTAFQRACD